MIRGSSCFLKPWTGAPRRGKKISKQNKDENRNGPEMIFYPIFVYISLIFWRILNVVYEVEINQTS